MLSVLFFISLVFMNQSFAVDTCINTTFNQTICFNADSQIYPQNIALWEGANEKYGLYVQSPTADLNKNYFSKMVSRITSAFDNNRIDPSKLGDDTTFYFQTPSDFYNFIQQQNAAGNVTLFTQIELNQKIRDITVLYTGEVIDWTFVLILIIVEFFKIGITMGTFLLIVFIFFRYIPRVLNLVKIMVFKMIVGAKRK